MGQQRLLILIIAGVFWLLSGLTVPAFALTRLDLRDISYTSCPDEYADGMVTPGSAQKANCYLIIGKVVNSSGKLVVNADIFGRIYDANNNPVMQNRTRLGSISEVPPGESDFAIRISVASNQPEPLKLEQFRSSGFTGRVRR